MAGPATYFSYYQRIVRLSDTATMGHEATLHALRDGQEIGPGEIFADADDADRLLETDWLGWRTAIGDAARWLREDLLFVKAATGRINATSLADTLRTTGLAPAQLVVQVSPPQTAAGRLAAQRTLDQCRALEVRVALVGVTDAATVDGFVGVEFVKLDRSLADLDASADVVGAIVAAAHRRAASVIAFGLERELQAARAKELGCDWGQGYVYGRPRRVG